MKFSVKLLSESIKMEYHDVISLHLESNKGRFTILQRHAPILGTLDKSQVIVKREKEELHFNVLRGAFIYKGREAILVVENLENEG